MNKEVFLKEMAEAATAYAETTVYQPDAYNILTENKNSDDN